MKFNQSLLILILAAICVLTIAYPSEVIAGYSGDVLRFHSVCNAANGGRMYDYWKFSNAGCGTYVIQPADYIEYDVYVDTNNPGVGGVDIMNTAGHWTREYNHWTDSSGYAGHPSTDLRPVAYKRWYHRKIAFPAQMVGTKIDHWDIAVDGTYGWETVAATYDNVCVTRNGNVVLWAYQDGQPSLNAKDFDTPSSIDSNALIATTLRKTSTQVGTYFFFWNYLNGSPTDSIIYKSYGLMPTTSWPLPPNGYAGSWVNYQPQFDQVCPGMSGYYSSMNQAWWESEFQDMKRAGIDFASIVYWGERPNGQGGVDPSFCHQTLASYLVPVLKRSGVGIKIACFDDTTSEVCAWNYDNGRVYDVPGSNTGAIPMPLSDSSLWTYFYDRKIKMFFQAIPQEYWATHNGLPVSQGGRPIVQVFWPGTNSADPSKSNYSGIGTYAASMWQQIKNAFANDFGVTPFLVIEKQWLQEAPGIPADSCYSWGQRSDIGIVNGYSTGTIQAGYDDRLIRPQTGGMRERTAGAQLVHYFNLQYNPGTGNMPLWDTNLLLIETWNELWEGSGICRAVNYTDSDAYVDPGVVRPGNPLPETQYMDMWGTSCVEATIGKWDYDATFLRTFEVPDILTLGSTVIPIHVRNDGMHMWEPDASSPVRVGIWLEDPATGATISKSMTRAYLPSILLSGQEADINFTVPPSWPTGSYNLRMDMVEEYKTWFSSQGDIPVTIPVNIIANTGEPANLLTNGDFEGWTNGIPNGWRWFAVNGATGSITETTSAGTYSSGQSGVLLNWSNNQGDSALDRWDTKIPTYPSHIYKLLVDAKTCSGQKALNLQLALCNSAGGFMEARSRSMGSYLTNDFQTFGWSARANDVEALICPRIDVANSGHGSSTYIDNTKLEDVTTSGNRLINGDFENSATQPLYWRFFNVNGAYGSVSINHTTYSGSNAVQLSVTTVPVGSDIGLDTWDDPVCVNGSETLMFSFAAMKLSGSTTTGVMCQVSQKDANGNQISSSNYYASPGSNCYSEFSNTVQMLPNAAYASIGFRITDSNGNRRIGSYLLDHVYAGAPVLDLSPNPTQIPAAKALPNDTPVRVDGAIVSGIWTDFFYIESDNRCSGIRVYKPAHGLAGSDLRVNVIGTLQTDAENGEHYIQASILGLAGTGNVLPLGITGGSLFNAINGVGAYNADLLVRTWGRVVAIESVISPAVPSCFWIDDGTGNAVKCVVPTGVTINPNWNYVAVTGISSSEMVGQAMAPVMLIRQASDITSF